MTALVAAETVAVALLALLVAGLLRSHAEILRRLDAAETAPRPPSDGPGSRAAADVAGETPAGDAVQLAVGARPGPTLLAFLTGGCSSCERFWRELEAGGGADLPGGAALTVVTPGPGEESRARLRALGAERLPVVMSSEAWRAYEVPVSPYFVHVHDGRVRGEGTAADWAGVRSLLGDAVADVAADARLRGGAGRAARVDHELAAAGIAAGHPSLGPPGEEAR